jgi:hypothetical protein
LVQSSGMVSESEAHSDSVSPIKWNGVRIRGSFGQHWSNQVEWCPNQRLIRTALVQSSGMVSESRAHSDSIGPIKWNGVRIRGSFGQAWSNQVEWCPNQRLIRTALVQSSGIVSELEAHSDSTGLFKWNRVRIRSFIRKSTTFTKTAFFKKIHFQLWVNRFNVYNHRNSNANLGVGS